MTEESLNLSLDDIIKRNADSSKLRKGDGGVAKRGGRGGRSADRASSFQPKIQTRVVKTIRGRGAGRGSSRGGNVRIFKLIGLPCRRVLVLDTRRLPADWKHFPQRRSSGSGRPGRSQALGS